MKSMVQQNCQIIEQLTEIQNGRTFYSFHKEEIGELLAKNVARTARKQLSGQHLLLKKYSQN